MEFGFCDNWRARDRQPQEERYHPARSPPRGYRLASIAKRPGGKRDLLAQTLSGDFGAVLLHHVEDHGHEHNDGDNDELGTSPVNADTAAANSRTKTNGLRNRPIKAASRRLGAAESMRFGPTVARIAAASDVLRPVSVECSSCRRSVRGRTARSDVPGAACSVAPLAWRCVAGSGAVTLGETEAVDSSGHARRERDKNKMR